MTASERKRKYLAPAASKLSAAEQLILRRRQEKRRV